MANTLTLIDKKRAAGGNKFIFVFQLVLNGSYTQSSGKGTPGETLNFNTALNPKYIARPKLPSVVNGSTASLPQPFQFNLPNELGGYQLRIEQNATSPTAANFVGRIFTSGGTELGSGSYSSTLTDSTGFTIEVTVPAKFN